MARSPWYAQLLDFVGQVLVVVWIQRLVGTPTTFGIFDNWSLDVDPTGAHGLYP